MKALLRSALGARCALCSNAGDAFDLAATRQAKESTDSGIARLVEEAQRSKAPMSRLASGWSLSFLAVTVAIPLAAWWFTSDPIRAVAVLVVATPCPLFWRCGPLACCAFRRTHYGRGALETMARVSTLILDKTGTLTYGRPQIVSIDSQGGMSEADVLCLAAALEQASKHPVAQAIVPAAKARGFALSVPSEVVEIPGQGVVGAVKVHNVIVGGFVANRVGRRPSHHLAVAAGSVLVAVSVDGIGRILPRDGGPGGCDRTRHQGAGSGQTSR